MKRIEIDQYGTAYLDADRSFVVNVPDDIDHNMIDWVRWADDQDIGWDAEDVDLASVGSVATELNVTEVDESAEDLKATSDELAAYQI